MFLLCFEISASGYDLDGVAVKISALIPSMMDYLMSDDMNLKLRLVLLLVATQREKLTSVDFDRLCTAAAFGPQEKALLSSVQTLNPVSGAQGI